MNALKLIQPDKDTFTQLIALHKANAKHLGFLPEQAFRDYATDEKLYGVINEGKLQGYVLFYYVKKDGRLKIIHLCVDSQCRKRGIAKSLVDQLKDIVRKKYYTGISLRCREDFDVNKLWPKLDFEARGNLPGRSQTGSTLVKWAWDNPDPEVDLFRRRPLPEIETSDLLLVVVDTNIFIDICDKNKNHEASMALNEDWLRDDIKLCITDELSVEINRKDDEAIRKRRKAHSKLYDPLSFEHENIDDFREKCIKALGWECKNLDDNAKSDLNHLTQVACSNANIFATRDEDLLKKSEKILKSVGLQIMRPVEIISNIDQTKESKLYSPAPLASTDITSRRPRADEVGSISKIFLKKGEKKRDFEKSIRSDIAEMAKKKGFTVRLFEDGNTIILLLSSGKNNGDLDISTIRINHKYKNIPTVLRGVLYEEILSGLGTWHQVIKVSEVTDEALTEELVSALCDLRFVRTEKGWTKLCVAKVLSREALTKELVSALCDLRLGRTEKGWTKPCVAKVLSREAKLKEDSRLDKYGAIQLEDNFWPMKVSGFGIASYIIPIRAYWAEELFDKKLSEGNLFPPSFLKSLSLENAYYSKSRIKLKPDSRILWYVSQDSNYRGESGCVRACSCLISSQRMSAKNAFKRFRRLGVYEWKDLNRKPDAEVTAFHFKNTECFKKPFSSEAMRKIGLSPPQGPHGVSEEQFLRIYKSGTNRNERD